jgi:hypothetical protein
MDEPETILRAELDPGEHLLWVGRSRRGILYRSSDCLVILFGLIWLGFFLFLVGHAILYPSPYLPHWWLDLFFGILFVLFGLFLSIGLVLLDACARWTTCYGVTNERVIIVVRLWGKTVKSIELDILEKVTLRERKDGSGEILLGETRPKGLWPAPEESSFPYWRIPSLLEVPADARRVVGIIRGAMRAIRIRSLDPD